MDSLRRKFGIQISAIVVAALALIGMIMFNVLRPSPEEKQEADLTQALLGNSPAQLSPDERLELQKQWRRLSPESRKNIFFEVARRRLEEFRTKTVGWTPEQRLKDIRETVPGTRSQLSGTGSGQAESSQPTQWLTSTEAAELTQHFMSFYQQELTDSERAELDPLIRRWLNQMAGRLLPTQRNPARPGFKAPVPEAETDE